MSVTTCTEIKGRSGELATKNEFTASRVFHIITDSIADDEVVVIQYIVDNVAAIGTAHPNYLYAWCKSISAQQTSDDGRSWTCTLDYGPFAEDEREESPFDKPAEIEYDFYTEEVGIDRDTNDERIDNSTGDLFEEPVQIPIGRFTINVTRNESPSQFDAATIAEYAGAVNGDSWRGFEEGMVQFFPGRARRIFDAKYGYYWQVSYSFTVNTDKFIPLRLLDQGYRKLDNGEPKYITDDDGEKLPSPALLDGAGGELPNGQPPVFLEFDHLRQLPFNGVFNF